MTDHWERVAYFGLYPPGSWREMWAEVEVEPYRNRIMLAFREMASRDTYVVTPAKARELVAALEIAIRRLGTGEAPPYLDAGWGI